MKKWKSLLLIGAVCTMCAFSVQAAEGSQTPVNPDQMETPVITPIVTPTPEITPEVTPEPEQKNGWVTLSKNRKRYYINGKLAKGWHKIKGKTYYFFEDSGTMATKWRVLKGKKYYFGKDGVCRKGVKQVGKRYFFFNQKGVLITKGPIKNKGRIYYLDKNGAIEVRRRGSNFYYANGKRMPKAEALKYETFLKAKSIVAKITNDGMTRSQKKEACFRWVMSKYYRTPRMYTRQPGWTAMYANDHFLQGSGDCFSDACAFAYLAKAVGYKDVNVCVDTAEVDGSGHCWAEIDGLVYDPLFAEAKSFWRNYESTYGVYGLGPMYKEAIKPLNK